MRNLVWLRLVVGLEVLLVKRAYAVEDLVVEMRSLRVHLESCENILVRESSIRTLETILLTLKNCSGRLISVVDQVEGFYKKKKGVVV